MSSEMRDSREPHDDAVNILSEMRYLRNDLKRIEDKVDAQGRKQEEVSVTLVGSSSTPGVFEQIRTIRKEQREVIIQYGSIFGGVGAVLVAVILKILDKVFS